MHTQGSKVERKFGLKRNLAFDGVVVRGQDLQVRVEVRGGFIRIRGAHFVMNGSPYYANGFNAYLADVFGS